MPPFQEYDGMGKNLETWLAADVLHGISGFQFPILPTPSGEMSGSSTSPLGDSDRDWSTTCPDMHHSRDVAGVSHSGGPKGLGSSQLEWFDRVCGITDEGW